MGSRTGTADLPLHGGRVPPWLAERMARLGRVVTEAIVHEYGRDAWLSRLAHPFWFQSFGAVMGMDWHSSGITTSVVHALQVGLADVADELGLYVCGGRGRHSRRTPDQLHAVAARTGLDGDQLAHTSRLVAKVDSAAVQDGFQIYLHAFIAAADGQWVVVQQGMSGERGEARRYHWQSAGLASFVDEPHAAIDGANQGVIRNLTDARARITREASVKLVEEGPDRALALVADARGWHAQATLPHMRLPAHHFVAARDVDITRLHATLAAAAERGPQDFAELLAVPGVGARTVESLALVAEVIHGAPSRFSDPGRFSYAHGGKDGHPFPVPLAVYDETIRVLKSAVTSAKLGREERLDAIRRLDRQARAMEGVATGQDWATIVSREKRRAPLFGGRTVMDDARERRRKRVAPRGQLSLLG